MVSTKACPLAILAPQPQPAAKTRKTKKTQKKKAAASEAEEKASTVAFDDDDDYYDLEEVEEVRQLLD